MGALIAPYPVLAAAMTGAESERLDQFDSVIFGKARSEMSQESRLRALETSLIGKPQSGSNKKRLDAIAKLVGKAPPSMYYPPMAAQMDTSVLGGNGADKPIAAAPSAKKSNSYSNSASNSYSSGSSNSYSSADNSYAAEDRAKSLLRDALQKYQAGNMAEADKAFRQVLAVDPRNADANFNLGAMAEERGDLSAAQRFYKSAVAVNPGDAEVKDALSAVEQKIQQQAAARNTQAQLAKRQHLKQYADGAAAAYKAGKYDVAINNLEKIARETPNDANVHFGLGQAYRGKGDLNRARSMMAHAVSLAPDNQMYRTTLSEIDRDMQVAKNSNAPSDAYNSNDNNDYGNNQPPVASSFDDGSKPGQIQPFANSGMPQQPLYGRAYDYSRGPSLGGFSLGGLGSTLGMGALAGGLSGGRMVGGSRIKRAAIGGLAGAAVGALTGRGSAGGMKSAAMKGALYGGLMGLIGF